MSGAFRADLDRFYRFDLETETPTRRRRLGLYLTHFGLHCVAVYRFRSWARRRARARPLLFGWAKVLATVGHHAIKFLHHVDIGAEIGPGFYIGHVGTIIIGPTSIGSDFSATHNVTIGIGHSASGRGIPVIGNSVWVGTGSVLSGPIKIGDRVTVASGTMLSRDAPEGCLVAGNPGRVLLSNYDNGALVGRAS